MTPSLDDRIRSSFDALAATTTIDDDARFGERRLPLQPPASRRPPALVWLAAAAAAVVAVVGVAVVTRDRASTGTGAIAVDASATAVGLFPPGDVEAVVAAGYATPEAAAEAYLADRTRKEVLPDGYTVTGTLNSQTFQNENEVLLSFSLATTDDTGDGSLLVHQVAPKGQAPRWVVMGAGIGSLAIDELDHQGARLTGSYTASAGGGTGRSEVFVFDARTGALLARTTDNPFTLDVVGSGPLAVRVWNTDGGGYPLAVFAEVLVQPGQTLSAQGFEALNRLGASAPAATSIPTRVDPTASAFDRLAVGATAPVVADADLSIDIRRADDVRPLCVDVTFGGRPKIPVCFGSLDPAAPAMTTFSVDALDASQVLLGGVVPDAITAVVVDDGTTITPVDNVWWRVVKSGERHAYTFVADAAGGVATVELS